MKRCCDCKAGLPTSSFSKDATTRDGLLKRCRKCNSARSRAWELAHPAAAAARRNAYYERNKQAFKDRARKALLRNQYGLTVADYDEMLAAQGGGCAICGTRRPGGSGRFHVDHDHATSKVRGLLCSLHNIGLGAFHDSVEHLEAAIAYLRRHGKGGAP